MASRTHSASCPSCGKPYAGTLWRWWMLIPIVAVAFAIGYFGIAKLLDDDSEGAITLAEAEAIELGISQAQLEDELGEAPYARDVGKQACAYYLISDGEDAAWEFCFVRDELAASAAIGKGSLPGR